MTGVVGGTYVGGPAVALGARVEWPGIIPAYRDRMPRVQDGWEVVTLREGGTPLLPAPHLSELPGARSTSRSRARTPRARSRTAA